MAADQRRLDFINKMLVSPVQRDNRIDSIRGLLLILITINHFGGWMAGLVWEPFGFVSDAEGFIFISGFVLAIVYSRYLVDYKTFTKKILHRALVIYRYHIYLLILIPLMPWLVPAFQDIWKEVVPYYFGNGLLKYAESSILLIYQPPFMDVLPMYVVFVLMSLPIIILLHRGKDLIAAVIVLGLWLAGQFINPFGDLGNYFFKGASPGYFNVFSWQIIFFSGVYIGYKNKLRLKIRLGKNRYVSALIISFFLICMALKYISRYGLYDFGMNFDDTLFNRGNMTALRLLNFFAVTYMISLLLRRIPKKYGIPGFGFLGKHSLQVFAFQVCMTYLILFPVHGGQYIWEKYGNAGYLPALALYLLMLFTPALLHNKFMKKHPKKAVQVKYVGTLPVKIE